MNPLNDNSYKFYLNFKNSFGEIEITEPVKFDGASFVIEQEKKRYGRDVSFMNESLDLFFYKGFYDTTSNPLQLPNGTITYNLTQGFEQLIEDYKRYGWESEIEFKITRNGIDFILGVLDFQNAETDEITYLSCKVIQDTNRQIIKRRDDLVIDMFSSEDIDGNEITPLETTDILLKAKPITQKSEWNSSGTDIGFSQVGILSIFNNNITYNITRAGVNTAQNVLSYGIENTLSYISSRFAIGSNDTLNGENFTFIEAQEDLSDINIDITNLNAIARQVSSDFFNDIVLNGSGYVKLLVRVGDDYETNFEDYVLWEQDFSYDRNINGAGYTESINLPTSFIFNIDFIPRGKRVYIYFAPNSEATFDVPSNNSASLVSYRIDLVLNSINIKVKATSTAIDSVVKGVRYIDVLKQTTKSISGLPVVAPKFDLGGKYYIQFAFTGNLIKGRNDLPFPVKFKDAFETIQEVNADYQVNSNEVFIGQYEDFYTKKEIVALPSYPDESSKYVFNDRFAINQFEFNYKTFEQDRDEENTTDAIHTKSQWSVANRQVENTKKVDLDQIRDAYKIESSRKLAVKSTTAESDDDKLFLIDVVDLAPNTQRGFTASLNHNVDSETGFLRLLNDGSFSWSLLGFQVGGNFTIENTSNAQTYVVEEIQDSLLFLSGGGSTIGSQNTKVSYFLNNVLYTNRSDEGLVESENLLNSDNYSNLRYSIKRNIKEWLSYLSTSFSFLPNGVLRNTYFKSNGLAATRFSDEESLIIENADIENEYLQNPVLKPNVFETKLVASFDNAVLINNALKTINEDNTIGGFIRTLDNNGKVVKGFPTKLEYEPATETLNATLELLYESEDVTITKSDGIIFINEVGYDETQISDFWYELHDDFLTVFDVNGMNIINPTHYEKVLVNGVSSTDNVSLSEKLIEIS